MRWGDVQSRLTIPGDSFDAFRAKVSPPARSITPFSGCRTGAFLAPGRFGLLAFLAFETDLFGLSHHYNNRLSLADD
jgi:hypothetical protein